MSNFSPARSAHLNATLRASSRPRACSRSIWMSAILRFFRVGCKCFVAFVLGKVSQPLYCIIKLRPVAANALEQRLKAGYQFIVGGLRTQRGIVGLRHPGVIA